MGTYARIYVAVATLALSGGCMTVMPDLSGTGGTGDAAIVGRVSPGGIAKLLAAQSTGCPDMQVSINGSPVTIKFDEDCSFVITGVQASALVDVRIELLDLDVAGTIELSDVADGELIEILVDPADESLTISVVRRADPDPTGSLPDVIEGNNVSILLGAGVYDQGLEVRGNNFTLVGEAGDDCDDTDGWSVITGPVIVLGNNATFRNIMFEGPIELRGNNPRFIDCCLGGALEVFGNGAKFDDEDDDDDGDGDDDD